METIILTTHWAYNYWEKGRPGKFTNTGYDHRLPDWQVLNATCPLPAIGLYDDGFSDRRFDYIIIKGITVEENDTIHFDYEFIKKGNEASDILSIRINPGNKRFYYKVNMTNLVGSLSSLNQILPEKWSSLLPTNDPGATVTLPTQNTPNWKFYIGTYFLELISSTLSNNEFEDRVAVLLTALGFKVGQKGHHIIGTVPDGVASYGGDIGLVYDCKNSRNYMPDAHDKRALESYYQDERSKERNRQMFPCFIAKTTSREIDGDKLVIGIEPLLYLLYKRLKSGSDFKLEPIRNYFTNKRPLTINNIDTYWD